MRCDTVEVLVKKMSKLKSQVWQHFTDVDAEKKVSCLYCPQTLSVANKSTCSLIRHLTKKHPHVLLERQAELSRQERNVIFLHKNVDSDYKAGSPEEPVMGYKIEESETDEQEIIEEDKDEEKPSKVIRYKSQASNKQNLQNHAITAMIEAKRQIDDAIVSVKSLSHQKQIEDFDEYDHFAHMIAAKLRKIQNMDERETVMNSIHNVVYQALRKNI